MYPLQQSKWELDEVDVPTYPPTQDHVARDSAPPHAFPPIWTVVHVLSAFWVVCTVHLHQVIDG